jgi:nucleoside phosphorylase
VENLRNGRIPTSVSLVARNFLRKYVTFRAASNVSESKQQSVRRAFIVTALQEEFSAVEVHLGDVREDVHAAGTVYAIGQFEGESGIWEVMLVQTGKGNPGAAIEAERGISRFDPNVVLMVGIAGGLKDVKVGDVVASDKVYYFESAKEVDGEVLPRVETGLSAHRLVQRAQAVARRGEWLMLKPLSVQKCTRWVRCAHRTATDA